VAKFKPGQSGNPAGRQPGTQTQGTKLRESLEPLIPTAIAALAQKIEEGDAVAIRVLLDRTMRKGPLSSTP
jgi:hypothetical protein